MTRSGECKAKLFDRAVSKDSNRGEEQVQDQQRYAA
jgi:hypothetical protein